MKTSKNNNGFRQHQLVIAEAASPERCLGGAGLYEVCIATHWHCAKDVIRKWDSALMPTFLRRFTTTSFRRFISFYARPQLELPSSCKVNNQSQSCTHCLDLSQAVNNQSQSFTHCLDLSQASPHVSQCVNRRCQNSLSQCRFVHTSAKGRVCGSATSEPHTSTVETHTHKLKQRKRVGRDIPRW